MMRQFVIDQVAVTQDAFFSSKSASSLITHMSDFLSLILQPQEILFYTDDKQLTCFAKQQVSQALVHIQDCEHGLKSDLSKEKLAQLSHQKAYFSTYLPITHLSFDKKNNKQDDWFCFKLKETTMRGVLIVVKNPLTKELKLWEGNPVVASLTQQFFHLLQQYQLYSAHPQQAVENNLQSTPSAPLPDLESTFSTKIITLHKVTQNLIASSTLNKLYKTAIKDLRALFHFDRSSLILADLILHTLTPTYSINELGEVIDESKRVLEIQSLEPMLQSTLLHTRKLLEIVKHTNNETPAEQTSISWSARVILRDGDNLIGWISLDNLSNKPDLKDYEKEILRLYSNTLSSTIIQKREEINLNLLHNSVVQLSHQKTELDICRVAIEFSREKLKLDRVAIFLSYDNGQTMRGTFGTSEDGEIIDETAFHGPLTKNALLKLALASDHELVLDGAAPLYHNNKIVGYGWNAAVLLRNHGKVIGFLVLDNLINQRPLTSHNKHLLSLFSTNLSEILARKRAEESVYKLNNDLEHLVEQRTQQLENVNNELQESNKKLAELSLVDPLTGLANRRHFDKSYQREWSTACRNHLSLSIVMLDIDYFKAYNDFYGHQQGDKCLRKVASILKKHFRRAGELACRYGGEEFVILVSHARASDVKKRIQAAIDELFNHNIEHIKTPLGRITLSAGVATFMINKTTPKHRLLKWADEALYQAKAEGKNQLIEFERKTVSSL